MGEAGVAGLVGKGRARVAQVDLVGVALRDTVVAAAGERRVVHGDHAGARGEGVGPAERGDQVAGAHGEGAPLDRDPALGRDVSPALGGLGAGASVLAGRDGVEAAVGARRHVHMHARGHPGGVEPRAHGVDELHRVGVIGGKARGNRGREAPVQVVGDRGVGGLLPCGRAVLQHVLGHLGGRRLGLDGDGAAAHQGHDRRGARLALGDGAVVGDDEPVAAGQLGRRARVKGHGLGARALEGTSELCAQRARKVGIGVEPLGSFLRGGLGIGHTGAVQHRQHGIARGAACPGEVGSNLGVAAVVDNVGAEDLVGIVAARHGAAHRDGTGRGRRGLRGGGEHDRAGADQEGKQRKQDREGAKLLIHDAHPPSHSPCDECASRPQQRKAPPRRQGTSE